MTGSLLQNMGVCSIVPKKTLRNADLHIGHWVSRRSRLCSVLLLAMEAFCSALSLPGLPPHSCPYLIHLLSRHRTILCKNRVSSHPPAGLCAGRGAAPGSPMQRRCSRVTGAIHLCRERDPGTWKQRAALRLNPETQILILAAGRMGWKSRGVAAGS